jgi:hypothetical protein
MWGLLVSFYLFMFSFGGGGFFAPFWGGFNHHEQHRGCDTGGADSMQIIGIMMRMKDGDTYLYCFTTSACSSL